MPVRGVVGAKAVQWLAIALACALVACGGEEPASEGAAGAPDATASAPAKALTKAQADAVAKVRARAKNPRPAPSRPTNEGLYAEIMNEKGRGLTPEDEAQALQDFLRVWSKHKPVFNSYFMGVRTYQNPLDAWVVQEVIVEVVPDVLVEAGTANGGSSLLWAMLLREVNPEARVITIDIEDVRSERAKKHPLAVNHVDFLLGSSTDPKIVEEVRRRTEGKRVLVLLDSLHTKEHIAGELAAYAPMVPVDSYVIVQDTPFGGTEAIDEFVAAHPEFVIDPSRERFVLTSSMKGYLKRVR